MEKVILYQNKKIFYRSIGSGKPVMLVHGFGETGDVWKLQKDFLKDKFHLIIPDLPGSGQSELIEDTSMEEMAEVLHAIIHEENISTCCVIAHSMGGYITLALAENYWNHVNAFGLFHSTAYPDNEEKKAVRRKGIEFIKQHGAFEFLKTTTPNLFSPASKETITKSINEFIDSLKNFRPQTLISYYEAMMRRPDRTAVLKSTRVPVLFVAGSYDNAVPFEDSLQQSHLADKTYFHILDKSGHMGMMEQTEEANQILYNFLTEIS